MSSYLYTGRSVLREMTLGLILLLLMACGCGTRRRHHITRAFYYWKTGYCLKASEQQGLDTLQCRKMYLRLFDVDWNESKQQIIPAGTLRWQQQPNTGIAYVPAVFITQRALAHLQPPQVPRLAAQMNQLIEGLCAYGHLDPAEIQIDCDWTAGSKNIYFSLLRALREQSCFRNRMLSCTIRLHQVKYTTRNGIPPADRGLLMCYNMGDMRKDGNHNSILNAAEAQSYLTNIGNYPLPLDLALPLFSQCLLYRNHQLQGILRDVQPQQVSTCSLFAREQGILYRVQADSNWHGFSLRQGDIIRVEQPSMDDIHSVASYALDRISNDTLSLAFFDCDSITLSRYDAHDLETIYRAGL